MKGCETLSSWRKSEIDPSILSSVEIKGDWNYTSAPIIRLRGVDWDNFTFFANTDTRKVRSLFYGYCLLFHCSSTRCSQVGKRLQIASKNGSYSARSNQIQVVATQKRKTKNKKHFFSYLKRFIVKPKMQRLLGVSERRKKSNIKTHLKETGSGESDNIHLHNDKD
jgi:hypothetical protein